MFRQYQQFCESKQLTIGKLWLYKTPNKWVLNFPTKEHWRNPSRVDYIEKGLKKFVEVYAAQGIASVAFPRIGCGHGELDWRVVEPLMNRYLRDLPIDVFVYSRPRPSAVPEHRDVEGMIKWLRSEPQSLPFSHVWEDLARIAKEGPRPRLASGEEFSFSVNDEDIRVGLATCPQVVRVGVIKRLLNLMSGVTGAKPRLVSSDQISIPREALLDLWQGLRLSGFVEARTMPDGLDRVADHLLPILSQLDYIRPVSLVAGSQTGTPTPGLRLYPQAFKSKNATPIVEVEAAEEALQRV
jgi:hypothetical protein